MVSTDYTLPPITPHVTATGYWRVHGFARDGTETLAFHPHTHTHITKPRAQHARVCNMVHQLSWRTPLNSRARGAPHIAQACDAVHATTYQHHRSSRSPDHPQPSCSEGVAQRHEHQVTSQENNTRYSLAWQRRMRRAQRVRARVSTAAAAKLHSRSRPCAHSPSHPCRWLRPQACRRGNARLT